MHREYPPRECSVCGLFNYEPIETKNCRQCGSPLGKIDYEWLKRQTCVTSGIAGDKK